MSPPTTAQQSTGQAASSDAEAMTTYRLFCMDWFGKIMGVDTIQAANDEEAVEIARELDLGLKCEVWDGQRLVARIEREVTGNLAPRQSRTAPNA